MIGCSRSTCAPYSNKPRHTLFDKCNGKNRVSVSLSSSCVYVNKAPPLTTRRTGLTGSLVLIEGEALGYKPRSCQNLCCLLLPSPGFQTTVRPFSVAVPKVLWYPSRSRNMSESEQTAIVFPFTGRATPSARCWVEC